MATSLSQQLKRLALPETSVYTQKKKKTSLLFDPKEAASIDRETFYEIGLSGLNELKSINQIFTKYEKTLFSLSSKNFERSIQSSEANNKLDKTIKSFLIQLSPYFLLQASHKALEWLINRYHIHKYNKDDFVALILPYHETKIFVRCLQMLKLGEATDRWNWLEPLQKPGIPLAKIVLFNHCASNPAFLHFISEMLKKSVSEFGDKAELLSTLMAFYCSSIVGTLEYAPNITESHVTSILPALLDNLASPIDDLRAAGFIITAHLSSKVQLKAKVSERLVEKLIGSTFKLDYESVVLLHILYDTQESLTSVSESFVNYISIEKMKNLCFNFSLLTKEERDISKFLESFLKGSLYLIQLNLENMRRFGKLVEMMVSEVKLKSSPAESLIKCVMDCYTIKSQTVIQGEDSDMDIIEDNSDEALKIQAWYSNFIKSLESQYPNEFDAVLKIMLKNNQSHDGNSSLNDILGFAPKLSKKLGNSFLFEKLYHQNPDMRVEAAKYINSNFKDLRKSNSDFLKESIIDRLNDDHPEVVLTILSIDKFMLADLLGNNILVNSLIIILHKGYSDISWQESASVALNTVCSLEKSLRGVSLCMALLPYLFPVDARYTSLTLTFLKSELGRRMFPQVNTIELLESRDDPLLINETIFGALENASWLPKTDDLLDIFNSPILESDYKKKVLALILLCFTLEDNTSSNTNLKILLSVSKFMENNYTAITKEPSEFSPKNIPRIIKLSKEGHFSVHVYTAFLGYLIKKTNLSDLSKPWIANSTVTSDYEFISKIYYVLVNGCSKKYQSAYSPQINLLINTSCATLQEKIEFLCNFIVGDLSKNDVESDENESVAHIRSLKILQVLLKNSMEDISWTLDSEIFVTSLLLSLYSSNDYIREIVFDILHTLISKLHKKHYITELFSELITRQVEIKIDYEQVPFILYTLLSPDPAVHKALRKPLQNHMKKSLNFLINTIANKSTPYNIKAKMCNILNNVNSTEILEIFSKVALVILGDDEDSISNIHKSLTLQNIISRINPSTVKAPLQEDVWNLICASLRSISKKALCYDSTYYVSLLMMQQVEDLFPVLPLPKAVTIISLIIHAGTFGPDSSVISSASKLIKKIELDAKHILPVLTSMHEVRDNTTLSNLPRKKRDLIPSLLILDSQEWKRGNTVLEYIQSKKKLTGIKYIMPMLFSILKKCLDFEEQSAVEYTKQLLLSSILHCSQKLYPQNEIDLKKIPRNAIDIELIVMCIRGTQNPQTHNHALMLLSQAAFMLPDQVLHHIMAIFTFIGSSVLRHDDAYSFQIITKIIESVIPILVKSSDVQSEEDLKKLENRVIPVLRIFVDVVLDVPEHRRLPLFKKLLITLNPEHFLWIFLSLLFESHVMHGTETKELSTGSSAKEQPVRRLDFAMLLTLEFDSTDIMQSCIKLIAYLKTLPIDKPNDDISNVVDPTVIFSVASHTSKQFRHFKYTMVTFINNILSSPVFVQQVNSNQSKDEMESLNKTIIVNILTYIQVVSKAADQNVGKPQGKYWKVMLHHSYEILDNINIMLSVQMFIMVIRGLMSHNLPAIRRKSMEILNTKLQHQASFFVDCKKTTIYSLLDPLITVIKEIGHIPQSVNKQELELNQQTALLSVKLLIRCFAQDDPVKFKPVLDLITDLTKSEVSSNLMASIVLCLAELCSNLKAHAIAYLPKFMPSLIKILKSQSSAGSPELVLLSVITAVYKIVETLPVFLSPYLEKLLYEFSILSAKWERIDATSKTSPIVTKLTLIKGKLSSTIAPRVLIPVVSQCYSQLVKKEKFSAVGPAMNILADSFVDISAQEFTALQQELTAFFLLALQFRNTYGSELSTEEIDRIEGHVIKALVTLILKLSESSFRPLYFKIYDWAVRNPDYNNKDRAITFYRLSSSIAENLKGLFILFAGHFIKNSADLLDACNKTKTKETFFQSEEKCCCLVENIVKTLHAVFLYDSQNFINKERFETIMQALVDQLDNDIGGSEALTERAKLIIPCVAQFAIATADDSLWKPLNYQILLKTRHNDFNIRLLGLQCMCEMASKLGDSWLPLLPESVPFLAELLEDEVSAVEVATQKAVQTLESVLGEPLQKYF